VATEGSVYQSKDKRWVAQYTDAKGKVRYIYRKPKPEAKSALRDALRVLQPTIGMMHESSDGLSRPYRHLQGIDHPTILGEWVSRMKAR
jgi:hypothetical protein